MICAKDERFPDVSCPSCGAKLDVEDSDDFEGLSEMERNGDCWMVCPVCEAGMVVPITWEPYYGIARLAE